MQDKLRGNSSRIQCTEELRIFVATFIAGAWGYNLKGEAKNPYTYL
jgi:hypothetical protein